jgi:hypothetical protein
MFHIVNVGTFDDTIWVHNIIYYIKKTNMRALKFFIFLHINETSLGKNKLVSCSNELLKIVFLRLNSITLI